LETDKDIDICYQVLSSLKILFVHARSMNVAYETHSQQVEEFLKQQCLPRWVVPVNTCLHFIPSTCVI